MRFFEKKKEKTYEIIAPISGKAVPLNEVPDEVFSQKVLGDGVAIIPTDGVIVSPVDGVVTSIPDSLHAYCFKSFENLDVLVHFGLETVSLQGEGFTAYVKEGDRVKKGEKIAEVDIKLLESKGFNTITPVLICNTEDNLNFSFKYDNVISGDDILFTLSQSL